MGESDQTPIGGSDITQYPASQLKCLVGAVVAVLWIWVSVLVLSWQLPFEVDSVDLPPVLDRVASIVIGVVGLFCGGWIALRVGRDALRPGTLLTLGPDGIEARQWKAAVRWENIREIRTARAGLKLSLDEPEPFMLQAGRLARWLGGLAGRSVFVDVSLLATPRRNVLAEIQRRVERARTGVGGSMKPSVLQRPSPRTLAVLSRLGIGLGTAYVLLGGALLFIFGTQVVDGLAIGIPRALVITLLMAGGLLGLGAWSIRMGLQPPSEASARRLRHIVALSAAAVTGLILEGFHLISTPLSVTATMLVFTLAEYALKRQLEP